MVTNLDTDLVGGASFGTYNSKPSDTAWSGGEHSTGTGASNC